MNEMLKRKLIGLLLACTASASVAQSMLIPKPSEGLMPNPAKGKTLFAAQCAACHGADLRGSDKGPSMLHKIYEPSHHSDAAFQFAVKNGVRAHHWKFGDMAAVPGLTPDDVAHITAYIRMEQRKVGIQ
ncbi:c-type cytochrome [Noviherbaspirillum sp. ST9]|uniref:c-type cytochrome n=1 Tax=Noviherbaspirillum sp. ST9 TaxID=3401606 RepID=UPI003B58620F